MATAVHNPNESMAKAKSRAARDTVRPSMFTSACLLLTDLVCDVVFFLAKSICESTLLALGLYVLKWLVDAEVSRQAYKETDLKEA